MILSQVPLQFPYPEISLKIAVSVGIGMFVGLEREWSQKEIGVRTFSITCLLGLLAYLSPIPLTIAAATWVLVLLIFLNIHSLLKDRSLELTTAAALATVFMLGSLVGAGHTFTAATSAIVIVMLLAWKYELERFAGALRPEEIRSAVLMGLLSVVIFPLLPNRYVDKWELLNPREAWTIVVVIAGIGFMNYVLLRLYRTKGLYYGALLGGLVNSTGTNAQLSARFGKASSAMIPLAVSLLLLTNLSMFVRNLITLLIFARTAFVWALGPVIAMALATIVIVWKNRSNVAEPDEQLELSSPLSLIRVLKFTVIFVLLSAVSTLAQRYFGSLGFLVVSALGGLISSASTTATAATLAMGGKITPEMAGMGTVIASMASVLVDLPLIYQQSHQKSLTRRFAVAAAIIIGIGIIAVLLAFVFARAPHGG